MAAFVIAEAGSCHDGSLATAINLVEVARAAGANACKFQFWSSAQRLAERRQASTYEAIYAKYQVPEGWLTLLAKECQRANIEFMCTVYLPEDIPVVAPFVQRFKVASFEAEDHAFIDAHRRFRKPILVSTGMDPIITQSDLTRLHCVSAYPTPLHEANLAVLKAGPWKGLSDHTACIYAGAFAVCAGATIVETHIRTWTSQMDNPDYTTALDPGQYTEYVRLIRLAERMLGDGVKRIMPSEAAMIGYKVRS